MKVTGIILLVIGILSTIGAIIGAANGQNTSFGGLAFIILGAFLISRGVKKKEEEEKKKEWENNSTEKE